MTTSLFANFVVRTVRYTKCLAHDYPIPPRTSPDRAPSTRAPPTSLLPPTPSPRQTASQLAATTPRRPPRSTRSLMHGNRTARASARARAASPKWSRALSAQVASTLQDTRRTGRTCSPHAEGSRRYLIAVRELRSERTRLLEYGHPQPPRNQPRAPRLRDTKRDRTHTPAPRPIAVLRRDQGV